MRAAGAFASCLRGFSRRCYAAACWLAELAVSALKPLGLTILGTWLFVMLPFFLAFLCLALGALVWAVFIPIIFFGCWVRVVRESKG